MKKKKKKTHNKRMEQVAKYDIKSKVKFSFEAYKMFSFQNNFLKKWNISNIVFNLISIKE